MSQALKEEVIGRYGEDDTRGYGINVLQLGADGKFLAREENNGFAGRQRSREAGTWTVLNNTTIELHTTELYSYYSDSDERTEKTSAVDKRTTLAVVRDAAGKITSVGGRDKIAEKKS